MLNKAQKLMNQRNEMINEAKQVLATLQATEEEMMYKAPMTNITINKGKIIEVEVTKEIVKEVTNDELQIAYDKLAEDFTNRCERIEELKEELAFKELLLNEFRENMDEKIKTTHELEDKIEDLEIELETKEDFIKGMKLSYEQQIAELKAEYEATIKRLNTKIMFLEAEDEIFEEETVADNEEVMPVVEEQIDKTDWFSFMSIPEELKDDEYVNNMYKSCGSMYNNATETRLRTRIIRTKEQEMEKQINDFNNVVEEAMKKLEKTAKYNLSLNRIENQKTNAYTSVYGKITLDGKEYAYKYDATFEYPVVYGCMDMDLIKEATSVLIPKAQFTLREDDGSRRHVHDVHYDFANNIVVWISDDGIFKGYTDKYAFVWDPSQAVPCGIPNLRAMDNFKRYKKMNAQCWSKGPAEIGQSIMEYCRKMMKETNAVKQTTKEIASQVTNDDNEIDDDELANLEW